MSRKKEVVVYLFTGLLDSGKSSFIRETLKDGEFEDDGKVLYLLCEQGEEECDDILLARNKITKVVIDEAEQLTLPFLQECDDQYRPQCVLVEYNGMWDMELLADAFPENWVLVQVITTVDATTFDMYMNNMKPVVMAQVAMSDLVVFNRCTEETNRGSYRRSIKAFNRKAQVVYESEDGQMNDPVEEEMPFDVTAPVIEVEDDDFGLWYMDALDNGDKYKGKTMKFKGQVFFSKELGKKVFVPGRFAMTCCADDVAFIGFVCHYGKIAELELKSWVTVTAKVAIEFVKDYQDDGPVLYAESVVPAEQPEEMLVYFT